ncbi:hypothetical protein TSOC_001361 [Tetrabaena socialis]|uniref:MYND-type domain-containing protein n=1 Tax=Tetrabaena socialis TaxID=47790 RepID=A0A2J8AGW8_9CHLO|nr:hypothetical protein TSOC_001361 [Tetrabaena socialis]|eukprot:PNH11762.1 hypothetical protein TSOC_001361 [Tetrabaena socialis]
MANELSEHLFCLVTLSKRLAHAAAPFGDVIELQACLASLRLRITETPDASKAAGLMECFGRKTFRVAFLQLFAWTQRLSGDAAAPGPLRRSAAHAALQIVWLAYELLNLGSTDAKVAGAKMEVTHYFVRMDAMESYSRLLGGPETAMGGSDEERERQLRCYAVGGVLLLDAALQASYLASSYSAKCGSCGVTGCGLSNEVFLTLERSQLFEHLSRAILRLAATQQRPGSGEDLAFLLRSLTDAGLRLVHSRWPPRYTDLQQMARVLAGPCLQYILSIQVVKMLCAADGGSTYGMAPGAALVPLMPPLVRDDTETVRAAALAALLRVISSGRSGGGERGAGAGEGAGPSAAGPSATRAAAPQNGNSAGGDGGGAGQAGEAAAGEGAGAAAAADAGVQADAGADQGAGTGAELDTACAELALVAWMCAHDSQAVAAPPAPQEGQPADGGAAAVAVQAVAPGGGEGAAAQAQEAQAPLTPLEAELRRYQALPPLLSRRAVYALCCRMVEVCIASAAAWEAKRKAPEQRAPPAAAALPPAAPAAAAPGPDQAGSTAAAPAATAPGPAAAAPADPIPDAGTGAAPAPLLALALAPALAPGPAPALLPEAACLKVALDALQCAAALANNRRRRVVPAAARPPGAFGSSVDDEEELEDLYDCFDAASYMLSMAIMGGVRTSREAPVENLREAISRAHAVVLGEAVELLVDTFPDDMRGEARGAAAAPAAAGEGGAAPKAGARTKRSGSAAAAGGSGAGGAEDGPARVDRARAASAGSVAEPAPATGPAASLLAVLQELMGPAGLFPKPLLLAKLKALRDGGSGDAGAGPRSGAAAGGAVKPYAGAGDGANVSLLVPPQAGLAVLGMRTCAYPACSCLEHDSELHVPLQGCGGCGRAAYCSRVCQLAHWRTGHKALCGSGAARPPSPRTHQAAVAPPPPQQQPSKLQQHPQPQAQLVRGQPPSGAPLTDAEARLLTSLGGGELALRGGVPLLEGLGLADLPAAAAAGDVDCAAPCANRNAALARLAARLYSAAPLDFKVTAQWGGGGGGGGGSGGGAVGWGHVVHCMASPEEAGEDDAAALAALVGRMLASMRDGTGWAL